MRLRRIERPLAAGLFLFAPFLIRASNGSPALNVGLKASWNGAPFLLELLETAAEENQASYFPLLDHIASGAFAGKSSEKDLYDEFLRIASAEGFLTNPEELSSFNLALSIHNAAPRIEAHYHYYENNLEPIMGKLYNSSCAAWFQWDSKQTCHMEGDYRDMMNGLERYPNDGRKLQFDRVLETQENKPAAILYGDIEAPEFRAHHERLRRYAAKGYVSYRVRYRPPLARKERPLTLSGYGVSLVLKKSDYTVMDDRDVEGGLVKEKESTTQQPLGQLEDAETHDIKPLQGKDLAGLGYKVASFVMASKDPFRTLQRLVQDFPKHSAAIAATEVDTDVATELQDNWEMFLGTGKDILWINGQRIEDSWVNAFTLLALLRRERRFVDGFKSLGLSSSEAIQLLSHSALAEAAQNEKVLRFDYRDELEGGNVIIWMNDLEKDSRYGQWSSHPNVLLRRVYPGQLHPLRRNLHNLVIPIDFTSKEDLHLIVKNLQVFVQRKVAVRFGLAPLTITHGASVQAKVIYHFLDAYGLQAALKYIEAILEKNDFATPSQKAFDGVRYDAELQADKSSLTLEEVLRDKTMEERIERAREWSRRLGTENPIPPIFVNGQPIPKDDSWTSAMSMKLQGDIMTAARYVYENDADEESDLAAIYLEGVAIRRNPYIFPESDSDVKLVNIAEIVNSNTELFEKLPYVDTDTTGQPTETSMWIIGDFDEQDGYELLKEAAKLQKDHPEVDLVLINNAQVLTEKPTLSTLIYQLKQAGKLTPDILRKLLEEVKPANGFVDMPSVSGFMGKSVPSVKEESWAYPDHIESGKFWQEAQTLVKSAGVRPGQRAIIVNGRVVGPISQKDEFILADFIQLLQYEHENRIKPVIQAATELGVLEKVRKGHIGLAALTNMIALTLVPDTPPGLLENPETVRTNVLEKMLKTEHTTISLGDRESATVQITASIDPAGEMAQKWVPLLKELSEMNGIHLRVFLNPARVITELPVKRFYRHVLHATPTFDESGRLINPRARFENIPGGPLLSLSMDVPPSWLVTPKESVHDLDNLKLDVLKERLRGADIEAFYELRNILIEGHSRDENSQPPRGVQLVLGTEKEAHFADTIVMANLGYFQFKANPGLWKMDLKEGRSKEIYKIDSFGTKGFYTQPEGGDPDIALLSFQGATLFPRLSRNPGKMEEDVLEASASKGAVDTAKKWFNTILGSSEAAEAKVQAEINIFSVASGHLYERFLNIMILSVMKNTKHTVKFWFIENFLSPSFKGFIPLMAAEYGFQYELVTYKWPHWLRAQTEKQREIWGYKILFLDVLFPLDLDKVIFVDADQIVRTDLKELVDLDLEGAPYGFTPMCDSRKEIEGFRFWKQGYWKTFLQGLPYHISALYVVDLKEFRQIAAGDRLRQQYHQLSADPQSLANLDQDLPNHMQTVLPVHSLPQDWLWCETWCDDESLKRAKTIDLCNNPMTKEPKLDRARRQVPEWTEYDQEVARLAKRKKDTGVMGHLADAVKEETETKEREAKAGQEAVEQVLETKEERTKDEL